MRRGLFVTGTDTNVGKTVVSAALMHRYRDRQVRYWKPIQTGIEQDDDTAEVRRLGPFERDRVLDAGFRLPRPVSPHLAARLNGSLIEIDAVTTIAAAQTDECPWIVEGAGGVLVPLNDEHLMIDLIARLALPTLVVARSGLGTINHTLLTIEALGRRALPVAGVVMVGPPDRENRRAIEQYGRVRVLGALPPFEPLVGDALKAWAERELDVDGRVAEYWT